MKQIVDRVLKNCFNRDKCIIVSVWFLLSILAVSLCCGSSSVENSDFNAAPSNSKISVLSDPFFSHFEIPVSIAVSQCTASNTLSRCNHLYAKLCSSLTLYLKNSCIGGRLVGKGTQPSKVKYIYNLCVIRI